jgi:transposase
MARRSCVERLVSDELWELAQPLIPRPERVRRGRTGRPRVPDRAALAGIVFVLKTVWGARSRAWVTDQR